MARRAKTKISYQALAANSAYLIALMEAAKESENEATTFFLPSSSPGRKSEYALGTLEDTKWERPEPCAIKAAALEKRCKELAINVKSPTRFPISPLKSTLDRARAEGHELTNAVFWTYNQHRSPFGPIVPANRSVFKKLVIVDSRGRTRAATKQAAQQGCVEQVQSVMDVESPTGDGWKKFVSGKSVKPHRKFEEVKLEDVREEK